MKIWKKTEDYSEGKFGVYRRDGTTPKWPHFVLGGGDPATPAALRAYAQRASELGFDPEYVGSIRDYADEIAMYREAHGAGDPDAGPHRTDLPLALRLMRGDTTVAHLAGMIEKAVAVLDGHSESTLDCKDMAAELRALIV